MKDEVNHPEFPCTAWWKDPIGKNPHDLRVTGTFVDQGKRWFIAPLGDNPAPATIPGVELEFYRG